MDERQTVKHKSEVAILTSNETLKKKSNTRNKEKFYDNIGIKSSRRHNTLKCMCLLTVKCQAWVNSGFPCGSTGKESACNGGDLRLSPELGRSPGEGKDYPLQYSGLEKSVDCIVHGVTKSWEQLSDLHTHTWIKSTKDQDSAF